MTHDTYPTALRGQFLAAIDMLGRAIETCPDNLWGTRISADAFWYQSFHALFYLDCYLSESLDGYAPPPPFTLDELDERGLLPDRVYSRDELLVYLRHGRDKCIATLDGLTPEHASAHCGFHWLDISIAELHLYNLRHIQHHAAQLNQRIRLHGATPPRWVRRGE